MKKKRMTLLTMGAVLFVTVAMVGCGKTTNQEAEKKSVQTFADYIDSEFFQDIPAMIVERGQIGDVLKNDSDVQTLNVNGGTVEDYRAYVKLLEENGYKKHSDNGEEGLENTVYNTVFTKGDYVVTVMHMARQDKTYITVAEELPLSDHLIYNEATNGNETTEAKTTLHMLELIGPGNSFVIQLKNGHFIVNDGGNPEDAKYLVDYLESLTPTGEKPVVEAWIISHPHGDHMGFFLSLASDFSLAQKVSVEGIYYCSMNATDAATVQVASAVQSMNTGLRYIKNSAGERTPIYRPQTGQRYYFDDITMDVVFTVDLMPYSNYSCPDANEASTWLMYTIEGQKFLLAGDADYGGIRSVLKIYDKSYFDVKVGAVFHHGLNIYDLFTDYMEADTLLYPARDESNAYETGDGTGIEKNRHWSLMKAKVDEVYCYGEGTVVLNFPYVTGTAKTLSLVERIYAENK